MPDRLSVHLTPAQIAGLLRTTGHTPGVGSPLAELPAPSAPPADLDRAAAAPLLDILAAPTLQVRTVVVGPEESLVYLHYGAGGTTLAGCWGGDTVHLSGPWEPADVAAFAGRALHAAARAPAPPMAVEVTRDGLTALAAAVDAVRAMLLASWAHRDPEPPPDLVLAQLEEQLVAGRGTEDARWTVTLLGMLLPGFPGPADQLDAGMAELVAVGLVSPSTHGWAVGPGLLELATDWLQPLPAISIETIRTGPGATPPIAHERLITLAGPGPLWVLLAGDADRVRLTSLEELDWLEQVTTLADPTRESPSAPPSAPVRWFTVDAPTTLLDHHGAAVDQLQAGGWVLAQHVTDGWVRCSGDRGSTGWIPASTARWMDGDRGPTAPPPVPAAPVAPPPHAPEPRHCPACDQALTPDERFCTTCGRPVELRCRACGAPAAPDDAFCTGCGTPTGAAVRTPRG